MNLSEKIRTIPDFPKEGISFKDITTLIGDGEAFRKAIQEMAMYCRKVGADVIVGPESRGFIFGAPLAYELGLGFIPVRKPGKLPAETIAYEYELEYGTDCLEMHKDAIKPGQKVVIADDLLATGGTINATGKLIESVGGKVVGTTFLIELEFLNGRAKIDYDVFSLVKY
jgi:adenine phosphoribosyltransferase